MKRAILVLALMFVASISRAAWREEVNGINGVPMPSRMTQFDVDDNGDIYVAQTSFTTDRRGLAVVRRIRNRVSDVVFAYETRTTGIGCSVLLDVRSGHKLVYFMCGSSERGVYDIDAGTTSAIPYLNQPVRMLALDDGLYFAPYAQLVKWADGALSTVFGIGTRFACDSSSTDAPLISSMAYLNKWYFAETACYGIGSLWRLNGRGVERITSFTGAQPRVGQSIIGSKVQSPAIDGRGNLLAVLDRATSTIYLVGEDLVVVGAIGSVPVSSGSFARVILGPRRVYVLDVQRETIYSEQIPGMPEPTNTPEVPTATPTSQPIPTNTPEPTATAPAPVCPAAVCDALRSAATLCGCGL
jgi:hypothetical protein